MSRVSEQRGSSVRTAYRGERAHWDCRPRRVFLLPLLQRPPDILASVFHQGEDRQPSFDRERMQVQHIPVVVESFHLVRQADDRDRGLHDHLKMPAEVVPEFGIA